ncbi:alpha/beta fold hydrolase [Listeria valentina]|uniref:alpha/beta fold hydrolase n=1 Tax=Listeria valentina TaxID=2705293 RepID=UPI0014300EE6|nr:alpha/beta hydrolase [Listeria valentina]
MEKKIQLVDGTKILVGLVGDPNKKVIMLPVAKPSVYGEEAESLKHWGMDPHFGKHFVEGLSDDFQILYFDYEGHRFRHPQPKDFSPDSITKDLLTIADQMKIRTFSYYGYSWLALAGLQLDIRTDRLESLIMGGFPPVDGPYKEMLIVTRKTYEQALASQNEFLVQEQEAISHEEIDWENIQVKIDPKQTQQFLKLYEALENFEDKTISLRSKIPRLGFAGEQDTIVYGEKFGNVTVDIVGALQKNKSNLEKQGWNIEILKGSKMNHTKAMQPKVVLPLLKKWLKSQLGH